MKKLEKALIALMLGSTLVVTGGSFAQQSQNQNQNGNRSGNRNGNRSGSMNGNMMNGNMNNMNSNMMMNGNMNSNMMNGNSNMMMNGNSNMMMGGNSNMMSSGMSMNGGMAMSDMIGNVTVEEFQRVNAAAGAAVAAITPNSTPLSKGDQKLFMEAAMGGMMQLEVSRAALPKVTSPQAKLLAQAEVEEQTAVTAKIREMATAKNITMPAGMDAKTQAMVSKMNQMEAGMKFDQMYVKESGVKGHQKLDKTMTKIQSSAADEGMKALANAALPNVRLHLQVSQAEVNRMSGKGMNSNSNGRSGSMNSNSSGNSNSNR